MIVKNPPAALPVRLPIFPVNPVVGMMIVHTATNHAYQWTGQAWVAQLDSGGVVYACAVDLEPGTPVAIVAPGAVAAARADDDALSLVLGIAGAKPTTTTCEVLARGRCPAPGVVAGRRYWLGEAGGLSASVSFGLWAVHLGTGEAADVLAVDIWPRFAS